MSPEPRFVAASRQNKMLLFLLFVADYKLSSITTGYLILNQATVCLLTDQQDGDGDIWGGFLYDPTEVPDLLKILKSKKKKKNHGGEDKSPPSNMNLDKRMLTEPSIANLVVARQLQQYC